MIRATAALVLLLGCLAATGCRTTTAAPTGYETLVARFFIEARGDEVAVPVTLPRSGVTINVAAKPVLVEYDLVNAEIAQVELGRCLLVQLSPAAARDLYRLSVGAVGRRLVLALNDQPLGARRIDAAMSEGVVLIFLETSDERLPEIVERLKRTSADLAAAARKNRS